MELLAGETPRHSLMDPRTYNSTTCNKIDDDQTRQIIDKWLLERGKFQLNPYMAMKKPQTLNLSSAKQLLKQCIEIVDKLSQTREELRANVDTMSSSDWKQKTLDIGCYKDEFDKTITVFEDNTVLKSIKGMVVKRKKKRTNQKKRKLARQECKQIEKEKRLDKHKMIDRWLESKKEEVERVKMEEKMKKDADCVLYEVTKKKSEARKQLSLISALVKLRTVRDSMATQRGEKLSLEDKKAFGLVTEKLIRVWENAYQNYCKEEQCLKIMLEHNATEDTKNAIAAKQTKIINDWEKVVFERDVPTNNPTYWALTSAERDLESFIAIRKSWDTFLDGGGSSIPIGWVMPPATPNENWAPYLEN